MWLYLLRAKKNKWWSSLELYALLAFAGDILSIHAFNMLLFLCYAFVPLYALYAIIIYYYKNTVYDKIIIERSHF